MLLLEAISNAKTIQIANDEPICEAKVCYHLNYTCSNSMLFVPLHFLQCFLQNFAIHLLAVLIGGDSMEPISANAWPMANGQCKTTQQRQVGQPSELLQVTTITAYYNELLVVACNLLMTDAAKGPSNLTISLSHFFFKLFSIAKYENKTLCKLLFATQSLVEMSVGHHLRSIIGAKMNDSRQQDDRWAY